mmetsp:Transcript_1139/g.1522  ORF Transcript_1139/g.1522 Transcript_1139/m.1522 type:complete len:458 (+) Transcript_1139:86-1459(+)
MKMMRLAPLLLAMIAPAASFSIKSHPTSLSFSKMNKRSTIKLHSENNGDGMIELTSALAKLDRQWQLSQQSKRGGNTIGNEWIPLPLNDNDTSSTTTTTTTTDPNNLVYLLEPSVGTPSITLLFVGGAGLGQFPHIAYNELLKRISTKCNAAVIAVPYEVGLDHFELAKVTGEKIRKALIHCEDTRSYSSNMPKFMLGHSLGAKLQTITLSATNDAVSAEELAGVGFMSFNNFGFKNTITMAKSFAQELRNDRVKKAGVDTASVSDDMNGGGGGGDNNAMFDMLFNLAEVAVGAVGVEFTPSPDDTKRILSLKYDAKLQSKTRLFVFDDDELDSSLDIIDSCTAGSSSSDGSDGLTSSGLRGSHLTPVFLKFGLEDLDLPEEAREMAGQVAGGFQNASFGDEEYLNEAVDEVCGWILGREPSRRPSWSKQRQSSGDGGYESESSWRLSGGVVDAEVE